jgi:hypothetical protein
VKGAWEEAKSAWGLESAAARIRVPGLRSEKKWQQSHLVQTWQLVSSRRSSSSSSSLQVRKQSIIFLALALLFVL